MTPTPAASPGTADSAASTSSRDPGIRGVARWLPWGLIGLGILLRLVGYLANRSLWVDEALLASNIVTKSALEFFGPLDNYQAAPLGFLFLAKAAVDAFGTGELALRLIPFLFGVLSLFLFHALAKECISPRGVPVALALFAISHPLIYYASEVKQYSSDVTIALLLQVSALQLLSRGPSPSRLVVLAIVGTGAVWMSHPAIFVLVGIGSTVALACLARRQWAILARFALVVAPWILSFLVNYAVHLRHLGKNRYAFDFWRDAFMPLPPLSLADLAWYPRTFLEIFSEPGGLALPGLAALAFVTGLVSAARQRTAAMFVVVSPLLVALLASGLRGYPFSGRLLLFTVPALLLLIGEGVERIRAGTHGDARLIGPALAALLLLHPIVCAGYHLVRPGVREEIKPVMSHVSRHRRVGDVLYLYYGSRWAFRFYAERYGFREVEAIEGTASRGDWRRYARQLDGLRGHERVWVVFSHVHAENGVDEEAFFLYHLDGIGRRLEAVRAPGAAAYLYDLSAPGERATGSWPVGPGAASDRLGLAPLDACRGVSAPASPASWMSE